uniref:Amino acid transporter transmembrane domain-containing protein n=1 Tax=Romanomermis culicivorax TaxID=13658 RepID=A0A915KWD9_ROMCU
MNNDPCEELPIQNGHQVISDTENIMHTVNNRPPFEHPASSDVASMTSAERALIFRYRFYNRLDPRSESSLIMPRHVIPASFFSIVTLGVVGKQGSLVTIFSIWNTMMGTALLAMPWAFNQAGFILGICCIIFMGLLAYYTAFRVIDNTEKVAQNASDKNIEFVDVCRYYFGTWGDATALMFSLVSLLGATIVYWVLMSNFLYYTGTCIYEAVYVSDSPMSIISMNTSMACDVICGSHPNISQSTLIDPSSPFSYWWQLKKTVPFYLFLFIFPFLNFESPTFFTAFNGLGKEKKVSTKFCRTVSVFYLLIFVSTKLYKCGVHFNLTGLSELGDVGSAELTFFIRMTYIVVFYHIFSVIKSSFPSLTGTLALSYFLHNCVVTIMKNQRTPKNNVMYFSCNINVYVYNVQAFIQVRDLGIAYILVVMTYLLIAILFFVGFPLKKDCIADFRRRGAIEADAPILMSFDLSFDWGAEDLSLLANNFDSKVDSGAENFGATDYSLSRKKEKNKRVENGKTFIHRFVNFDHRRRTKELKTVSLKFHSWSERITAILPKTINGNLQPNGTKISFSFGYVPSEKAKYKWAFSRSFAYLSKSHEHKYILCPKGSYNNSSVHIKLLFTKYEMFIGDFLQNFLNNFGVGDLLSAVARIFLLFQMLTVYPLLAYLIRIQVFYRIYKDVYPRFVGSISGLVYVFALPCLVHMKRLEAEGRLTKSTKAIHYSIVFAGIANLIAQFI